jgi:hypothetical protein
MKFGWGYSVIAVALIMAMSRVNAAQTLTFANPTGGEVYVVGQTQSVRFNGRFKSVLVEMSTDGGTTFTPLGTLDSTLNPSGLAFTVTGPVSAQCVMRATASVGKTKLTGTSGMFTVVAGLGNVTTITNNVTIPDQSITNAKLAPNAVTSDKFGSGQASAGMVLTADGSGNTGFASIVNAPVVSFTGPLAGDITGTQGATLVSKLSGIPLASTVPTDNQVLRYNASANRWEPGTFSVNAPITSITGTPNQINVQNNNGAVTLSAPQNLATNSSPTFLSMNASSANITASSAGTLFNVNNSGSGLAANFSSPNETTVKIDGGDGPVLDVTGRTGDAMHAQTQGTSTSGIFAESTATAVGSYGIYAISYAPQGQGSAVMARGYSRDGYALQVRNESTEASGGGGMLVDQEGTTNNIAVFQSSKVTRAVIDNSGTGSFARLKSGSATISSGTGVPNNVVSGNVGDLFLRTDGGAGSTLWVKESGNGTTSGWTAK